MVAALAAGGVAARGDDAAQADQAAQYAKRMFAGRFDAKGKSYACFARRYDAAHLAKHPKQTVKYMTLLVSAEMLPEDKQLNYGFQFNVGFRDRKGKFSSSGSCGHAAAYEDSADKLHIGCGVDCDGGGVSIELADADKAVLLRLGSVAIWNDSKPDDERDSMEAGADDGVFRLDRVKLDACKPMMRSQDDKPATM